MCDLIIVKEGMLRSVYNVKALLGLRMSFRPYDCLVLDDVVRVRRDAMSEKN